jgi:hypothetical protein
LSTRDHSAAPQPAAVSTCTDFLAALRDDAARIIAVEATLTSVPSFSLPPGKSIEGRGEGVQIRFADGEEGVVLTRDNGVANLRLETGHARAAILNDTSVPSLGIIRLRDVTTVGRVRILARDAVRAGHVDIDGLDVTVADARAEADRAQGFGVSVIQGAFTLWNMQRDPEVEITATLLRLSAGRDGAPVSGSGIFVGGASDAGGWVTVDRLETGAVHSNGGIAPGTPDQISGGVFVVHACRVKTVRNRGPVTTYGPNDMVLDNWGSVERWTANAPITSLGPSGIGFVNFGALMDLRVDAPIETFGEGARGFNVYDGTLESGEFSRIVTHGDGAVGIQISKPIGHLLVRNGIETFGGVGKSLVEGVVMSLPAAALSIKPGGYAKSIEITGGLTTNRAGIPPIEMQGGVSSLRVSDITTGAGDPR